MKPSVLAFGYYLANFITTPFGFFLCCNSWAYLYGSNRLVYECCRYFWVIFGCCAAYNVWNSDIQCCQFLLEITGANFCSQCNYQCRIWIFYVELTCLSLSFQKEYSMLFHFLPGTYGTSLVRNHAMQGVF